MSLREGAMKLRLLLRPPQPEGHCEDKLSSVVFFFFSPPHSNLGSARSQQGQGIAQCDTA